MSEVEKNVSVEGCEGLSPEVLNKINKVRENNFVNDGKIYFLFNVDDSLYWVSSKEREKINLAEDIFIPKISKQCFEKINDSFDIKEVSNELLELYKKYFDLDNDSDYNLLVAWTFYSKMYNCFSVMPYIIFVGVPGSGKSTIAKTLSKFNVSGTKVMVAPSTASIFRYVNIYRLPLFIDEFEKLLNKNAGDLISIIDSGYKKGGQVIKVNKDHHEIIDCFNVFSPKLMCVNSMNAVPETIKTRSLIIQTHPFEPKEQNEFLSDEILDELNGKIYSVLLSNEQKFFESINLSNFDWSPRQKEISASLLKIAKAIGFYDEVVFSLTKLFDDELDVKLNSNEFKLISALSKDLSGNIQKIYSIEELIKLSKTFISPESMGYLMKNLGLNVNKKRKETTMFILDSTLVEKSAKRHGYHNLLMNSK
ncbi:MAG: hypothetical protein PHP82_02055 [Candidatus ainarchaeum sp.]|nr:hypothetical protein [Candidatus ainarchaeum sp.]